MSFKSSTRHSFTTVLTALALAMLPYADAARADVYPIRPITLVVPFTTGGTTDMLASIIAEGLAKNLRVPVVLEHLAGGGGAVGADRVANAGADGYTLLIDHIGVVVRPLLDNTPNAAPLIRFEPLGEIAQMPSVVLARGDFHATSMRELLKVGKTQQEPLKFSHAGRGSAAYLCGLLLRKATGIRMKATAFKGGASAVNDVLAGKQDLTCDRSASATRHLQHGQIIALGVTSKKRIDALSTVPTLQEQGLKGFEFSAWSALYAPKGTPREIVHRVHDALRSTLSDPTVVKQLQNLGATPSSGDSATLEYARAQLGVETSKWSAALDSLGTEEF